MFKKYSITLIFISCSLSIQADDCSINKFISDYLTRINTYILDDDYVNAKKELDTLSFRYLKMNKATKEC